MTTTDRQDVSRLYRATRAPQLVRVPPMRFLHVDGHGDPNTSATYSEAVPALYALSYAARFAVVNAGGPAFTVSALEGLWWAGDMDAFLRGDRPAGTGR